MSRGRDFENGDFCGPFSLEKTGGKNQPKNPRQNSNQNLGVSRPKSTLQESALDKKRYRNPILPPKWFFRTTDRVLSNVSHRAPLFQVAQLAKASAPYRGQNRQNREKRVSGSKNSHMISQCTRNGRFESKKSPFLYTALQGKWGYFDSKRPFLGHWEIKWEFFDPETLFSRFWRFDPCKGADAFASCAT